MVTSVPVRSLGSRRKVLHEGTIGGATNKGISKGVGLVGVKVGGAMDKGVGLGLLVGGGRRILRVF